DEARTRFVGFDVTTCLSLALDVFLLGLLEFLGRLVLFVSLVLLGVVSRRRRRVTEKERQADGGRHQCLSAVVHGVLPQTGWVRETVGLPVCPGDRPPARASSSASVPPRSSRSGLPLDPPESSCEISAVVAPGISPRARLLRRAHAHPRRLGRRHE